tara:strand:- start:531 stop:821 length:291 start_codon:yes stop_codon:yes gene_type:complete
MSLTRNEVERVSLLARLQLTEDELETMTTQLNQIVGYVEQLAQLPTDNIQPMAHGVERFNVFAADDRRPSLPCDEALTNAPRRDDDCYLVPAVLGD